MVNEDKARASLISYLGASTYLKDWPQLKEILTESVKESSSYSLLLPLLTCEATGTAWEKAVPVAASWHAFHEAAIILDAIQDQDQYLNQEISAEEMRNLSTGLITAVFLLSSHLPLSVDIFSKTMFYAALGNQMSLGLARTAQTSQGKINLLEKYWETTILRSGSIFRAGTAAGAAVSTGSMNNIVDLLGDFGTYIGVIFQIFDDCSDIFSGQPADSFSLPWILYFDTTGEEPSDGIEVTREMMVESGVQNKIAFYVYEWQQKAKDVLNALQPRCNQVVLEQLETVIPEWKAIDGDL
jgi:geranylgeranyl pyrophosphate synthase